MKKILAFLLVLISCFSCSACAADLIVNKSTFHAEYDYGLHTSGKVTLLLSGSLLFFTPEDYGITEIVAGDEIVVTHTGIMKVLMSYPGRVIADKNQIKKIEVVKANVSSYSVIKEENGNISLQSGCIVLSNETFIDTPYVINTDGTFKPISDCENEEIVYVTHSATSNTICVAGIYAYNPRPL